MHLAAPLERRRPFTTSGNKCPQAHEVLSKLATNLTFLTYPARRLDLTRFSIMEQVTGIEPVSQPWQGRIITAILYLHMYKALSYSADSNGNLRGHIDYGVFPITPDSDKWFAVIPKLSRLKRKERKKYSMYQGTK